MKDWRKKRSEWLEAMPKKGKQFPHPFPGAYPTRWALVASRQLPVRGNAFHPAYESFTYFGKPNMAVARRLERIRSERGWYIKLVEFDQDSAVQVADTVTPAPALGPRYWSPELCSYYYPRQDLNAQVSIWTKGVKTLRLKAKIHGKVRGISIYAGPTIDATSALLREHITWLEKAKANIGFRQ